MQRISRNNGQDYLDWREGSGGTIEIFDIAVMTNRMQGIGRDMLNELIETVKGKTSLIFAITREVNLGGHRFYEKTGFRLVGKLHHFYRFNGEEEDARMYGLEI